MLEFFVQSKTREMSFAPSPRGELNASGEKTEFKRFRRSKSPSVNDFNLMGLQKKGTPRKTQGVKTIIQIIQVLEWMKLVTPHQFYGFE